MTASNLNIAFYVDGQTVSFPAEMVVSAAAALAMNLLGKQGGLILARESGSELPQQSALGAVCEPGERLTLVPGPKAH